MRLRYDLHLHSCLSPCGSDDMTPNNLVNMAALLGYDLIAVTDHNACGNAAAVLQAAGRAGLLAAPGMELCTEEEAHVVCLFPALEAALEFESLVRRRSMPLKNRPEIFGRQLLMDGDDRLLGEEERMLISAAQIGAEEAACEARRLGGAAFPAHVDKNSYSILASLGDIPPEPGFRAAEISPAGDAEALLARCPALGGMLLLTNLDAHYLENMRDPGPWLDLPEKSLACLISALNGEISIKWSL